MHWTLANGIDCPGRGAAIGLKASFDQVDDRRLTTSDRSHQEKYTFTDLKALSGGVEVIDDLLEWLLNSKDFLAEEFIAWLACASSINSCVHNHVIYTLVGESADLRRFASNFEVLCEVTFPHKFSFAIAIFFQPLHQIHSLSSLYCMTKWRMDNS